MNDLKVVIGSYGSYAACNERTCGSKWIDLNSFNNLEEIKGELIAQGFKLNRIDEELFLQDYESDLDLKGVEFYNVCEIINLIYESEILLEDYKFNVACAICETYGVDQLINDLREYGADFAGKYCFYENATLEDLAVEFVEEMALPEIATRYFDYAQFAIDLEFDGYAETSVGVICC